MNDQIKYSYIIPAYNKEKYIKKTMESLMSISHKNVEFIIIDDGSNDSTAKVIEREISKDSRFKFFQIGNNGVSYARNIGIEKAVGDYILFCDADDEINPDILHYLDELLEIKDYDLIQFNMKSNGSVNDRINLKINNFHDCKKLKYFLRTEIINSVCTKCFKRNLISKHEIKFTENIHLGEDLLFSFQYYINASSVYVTEKVGYSYRNDVVDSLTNNKDFGRYNSLDTVHDQMTTIVKDCKKLKTCQLESTVAYLKVKRILSELVKRYKSGLLTTESTTYLLEKLYKISVEYKRYKFIYWSLCILNFLERTAHD